MNRETNLAQVAAYVALLAPAVGGCKQAVDEKKLLYHFKHSEIAEMVLEIKQLFLLNNGLRLGLVNSGGFDAPAWIVLPAYMPMFGSSDFARLTLTLYVKKSFIAKTDFNKLCLAIAHELSHVVIESIGHRLKKEERAVDLLAMVLGFAEIYGQVALDDSPLGNHYHGTLSGLSSSFARSQHGYLTPEERTFARDMIIQMRKK